MYKNKMSPVNHVLIGLDCLLGRVESAVLGMAILALAAFACANVFGRFVFSESIYFVEELNEFLMVLITFFGLGYVTRNGRHIRMTAIYDQLPAVTKKALMIVIALVTAGIMFALAYFAIEYVAKTASRGRLTPALKVPLYLAYVPVVLGFVITGVQYLLTAWRNLDFTDPDVYVSYRTRDEYEAVELADSSVMDDAGRDKHSPQPCNDARDAVLKEVK
ncbi:TRAP transporter small permease [Pseudomonas borbori]|uniref:TRAP transporter small permease protein n=1 Tax=Pseudomonas borbori TaxID=289003 RepID=A0A1I5MU33_9PSED|nr:TRAP transporter small permease [Pseudomonas borbori]SFP13010.1 TRAP-type C4-dicarboxylate transport system, small permease component [Pseudomonas borbori]